MGDNLLPIMIEDKIRSGGLSIRAAAREIGIAHTSLGRILRGENADLATLQKISAWLGVNPSDVVDVTLTNDYSVQIATLIQSVPELKAVFKEALSRLENGTISHEAVQDLIRYAAFRLSLEDNDDRPALRHSGDF